MCESLYLYRDDRDLLDCVLEKIFSFFFRKIGWEKNTSKIVRYSFRIYSFDYFRWILDSDNRRRNFW